MKTFKDFLMGTKKKNDIKDVKSMSDDILLAISGQFPVEGNRFKWKQIQKEIKKRKLG